MKVNFKEFNNKSRKGTYVYIKEEKKAGRYYKYNVGDSLEGIVAYHKDEKKKGSITAYKREYGSVLEGKRGKKNKIRAQAQRLKYKKHLGKKLGSILEKGLGTATIKDLNNATKKELQEAKEQMLKKIVLDPEIRTLVATEENLKKLSKRLQINLIIKGTTGKTLDEIKTYGKTIEEVQEKTKRFLPKGVEVTEKSGSPYQQNVIASQLGKSNVIEEDLLATIVAELIFRKN